MVFSLFLRKFGLAAATTFVVLYLSHQGWSDLLPRLGPTEFYGNSIIVILVWLAWKYERGWIKNGPLGLIGIAASSFLFATLKEVNSVFLVEGAVLSILCGLLLNNPRLKTLGILCGAIGCAVFAFLILTVRKVSLPSGSPSRCCPFLLPILDRGSISHIWIGGPRIDSNTTSVRPIKGTSPNKAALCLASSCPSARAHTSYDILPF